MFKYILLPIDGSALANKALREGLDLAKSINAKVTCVFVVLPKARPNGRKIAIH